MESYVLEAKNAVHELIEVAGLKKGQVLDAGDAIGEMGSTGRSTGPHLHYEILYQGKDVDPMPFIKTKPLNGDRNEKA